MVDLEVSGTMLALAGIGAGATITASVFGIRKLIQMGKFSYHNARLSTIGNMYVRRDEVMPLVDLNDPSALSKTIQGDLAPSEVPTSFREADRHLMHSFHGSLDSLMTESPDTIKPLVRSFIHIWEVEELKRLMRLIGIRKEPLYPIGFLDEDTEVQFLNAKDRSQALEVLEGQKVGDAISPLTKEDMVGLEEIDSILDRYVLDELVDVSELSPGNRKGARYFADLMVDRYNLHYITRSKYTGLTREEVQTHLYTKAGTVGIQLMEQMIESANLREAITSLNGTHLEPFVKDVLDKGIDALEIAFDRMLLNGSIGLSNSFGSNVGPTIRFMVSKEMEVKNLRTIYQGSFSNWDPVRTRDRLILEEGSS